MELRGCRSIAGCCARSSGLSGLCALPFSGRTLSLSAPNEVLFGADGATGLPVDRRLLRTLVRLAACARSHFRAGLYPLNRGRAPPAPGTKRTTAGPAGGGRMADQLWGRVGSSGLASARVGGRASRPAAHQASRRRRAPPVPPCHTPSRPHHCIIIENSTSSPLLAHLTRARVFKICHHPAGATARYRVVLSREFSFFSLLVDRRGRD